MWSLMEKGDDATEYLHRKTHFHGNSSENRKLHLPGDSHLRISVGLLLRLSHMQWQVVRHLRFPVACRWPASGPSRVLRQPKENSAGTGQKSRAIKVLTQKW